MKIETLSNGHRIVKRYRGGYCYACVWAPDTTDKKVVSDMAIGYAEFRPYNEGTGEFVWGSSLRPIHFRR